MSVGMFLVGLFTVAQLSFWGNYLPHVYPVHLRGTGESFAANIGGRLIGTLPRRSWPRSWPGVMPFRPRRCSSPRPRPSSARSVYLIGFAASFWLPEPDPEAADK